MAVTADRRRVPGEAWCWFLRWGGRYSESAPDLGVVAIHQSGPEQCLERRARTPGRLLLPDHAQVLSRPAPEREHPGEIVGRRNVLTAAQALSAIDPASVRIQQSTALGRDVARGALAIPQANHRRQGERLL